MAASAPHRALLEILRTQIEAGTATSKVLSGAWHTANKAGDTELLALIAASAQLPDELRAQAMARNEISIVVAYLSRTDLDPAERLARITAEQRASVLAGVAEQIELTAEEAAVIGAKLTAKPTRALAEAIVNSSLADKVSTPVLARALVVLASRYASLTGDTQSRFNRALDMICATGDVTVVAAEVEDPRILGTVLATSADRLDGDVMSVAVERAVSIYLPGLVPLRDASRDDAATRIRENYDARAAARGLANWTKHALNAWSSTSTVYLTLSSKITEFLRARVGDVVTEQIWTLAYGSAVPNPEAELERLHAFEVMLAEADTQTDPDRLAELVAYATRTGERQLAAKLLANPAVEPDEDLVGLIAYNTSLVVRIMQERRNDKLTRILYWMGERSIVDADRWRSFADPLAMQRQLLAEAAEEALRSPTWWGPDVRRLNLFIATVDDAILVELPWSAVQLYTGSRHSEDDVRLIRAVSAAQTAVLGDDLEKWETFAVLANDFSGSIQDLLTASAIV